jgi:hypothetical protein
MRVRRVITGCLLLICLVAGVPGAFASGGSAAGPAGQQNARFIEDIRAGYGDTGSYIVGEWIPVRVTLANPGGGGDRRVRAEVSSVGESSQAPLISYARDVDLPAQSRKVVTLYAYTSGFLRALEVRLYDGGSLLERREARIEPVEGRTNIIVGVVSSDPALLNNLTGAQVGHADDLPSSPYSSSAANPPANARTQVVHITLDDIPESPPALSSLGAIIIDDLDTAGLNEAQRRSLEAWVLRGGSLIAFGRSSGAANLAGVADLLPVTLGPPRQVGSLQSLGDLVATPLEATGPVFVPGASLKREPEIGARPLATDVDLPLVAMRELGRGHVSYVALSPSVEPLDGWGGTVPLVKRLLAEHPLRVSATTLRRTGTQSYGYYGYYGGGMFDLPGLDLPEPLLIALFLMIYVGIVGPINFIVLRRMRKQEWAWATVPALVLVFSVGAYLIGYGSKGGDSVVLRADLVTTSAGAEQANLTQFLGIFSPSRNTYGLAAGPEALISEMGTFNFESRPNNPVRVVAGDETRVEDININTWALRGFMAESATEAQSPLELDLTLQNSLIVGTARNRSQTPLDDVALMIGDSVQHIGTIEPGEERPVSLPVSRQAPNDSVPQRVLPPPSGVQSNPYGGGYYDLNSYNDDASRLYRRKAEVLGIALGEMATYTTQPEIKVLAFAWGEGSAGQFRLQGSGREEAITLWASHTHVRGSAESRLSTGLVPYSVYIPADDSYFKPNPNGSFSMRYTPNADIMLRLPPGTIPQTLEMSYMLDIPPTGTVRVLAYNPNSGMWVPLAVLEELKEGALPDVSLEIPAPAAYTDKTGMIVLRFLGGGEGPSMVGFSELEFSLNSNESAP